MITESYMYWILKLDDIRDFAFVLGMVGTFPAVAFLIFFLASKIGKDDFCKDYVQVGRLCGWLGIATTILTLLLHLSYALLPTTKQMAMIKVIPAIANSDEVKVVSNDAKELYKLGVEAIRTRLINECKGASK
jgi:hypothetical protein